MDSLITLCYVSVAMAQITDVDIRAILQVSRMLNRQRDLTGLLACTRHHFMQILEGSAAQIDRLLASLLRDSRHTELHIIRREPITQRLYDDWHMAFVPSPDLGEAIAELHAGFATSTALRVTVEDELVGRARQTNAGTLSSFYPSLL